MIQKNESHPLWRDFLSWWKTDNRMDLVCKLDCTMQEAKDLFWDCFLVGALAGKMSTAKEVLGVREDA